MKRFDFKRNGDVKGDPKGAQVVYYRHDSRGNLIRRLVGDVIGWYRDEDETPRLSVRHFNGEPWPVDPPASSVLIMERTYGD